MKQVKAALEGKLPKFEKLTSDDILVLFYNKCKCNDTFNSMAVVYDVSPRNVSLAFESVLEVLFVHSKTECYRNE